MIGVDPLVNSKNNNNKNQVVGHLNLENGI